MISALRGITNADQGIRSGAWTPVQGGLVKGRVVIESRVEGDDVAEAIDTGAAPDHGTSRDAFLTMSLVDSIYYAHEQWRARHSIPNPKNYTL